MIQEFFRNYSYEYNRYAENKAEELPRDWYEVEDLDVADNPSIAIAMLIDELKLNITTEEQDTPISGVTRIRGFDIMKSTSMEPSKSEPNGSIAWLFELNGNSVEVILNLFCNPLSRTDGYLTLIISGDVDPDSIPFSILTNRTSITASDVVTLKNNITANEFGEIVIDVTSWDTFDDIWSATDDMIKEWLS